MTDACTWTNASDVARQIIESSPIAMFVLDSNRTITYWNRACEIITGVAALEMIGSTGAGRVFYSEPRPVLGELMVAGDVERLADRWYHGKLRLSNTIAGAYEAEDFFPHFGSAGRWLTFTVAPIVDRDCRMAGSITSLIDVTEQKIAESALITLQVELEQLIDRRTEQLEQARDSLQHDIERRKLTETELRNRNEELVALNDKWSQTQAQLLQSEKMASVGQLAAGVAHEINNPIAYVQSNVSALERYLADLLALLDAYQKAEALLPAPEREALVRHKRKIDLDYLRGDVIDLTNETKEGITRVRHIVQDLKDFSRANRDESWESCDLRRNLDSTLNIVANEIRYCAEIERAYDDVPMIECLPSQLSQVFLNLLINATHAFQGLPRGLITISVFQRDDHVVVRIADTGKGIATDVLPRIFDPFFTTKPVGEGTGLGLSLSYGIVRKHHGTFEVQSTVGKGTSFEIALPIQQASADASAITALGAEA